MSRPPPAPTARGRAACTRASARLWAYLDGELTPPQASAVGRHLGSCVSCGRHARQLRALLDACREAGCGPLPKTVAASATKRARAVLRAAGGVGRPSRR